MTANELEGEAATVFSETCCLSLATTPPQSSSSVVRNDVGSYSPEWLRSLSDSDKLWLLKNACRPDSKYK